MCTWRAFSLALLLAVGLVAAPATAQPSPGVLDYQTWIKKGDNRAKVLKFETALGQRGLLGVVPTYQILRTAMSWKACRADPFELPAASYWDGAFQSLTVLRDDIIPAIGPVEIVSGYRHAELNRCAGGAARSVHREFGAFDAYAVGRITRAGMIRKLCDWHGRNGARLSAGLGIYRGKKFHVDVGLRGNRRWGSDYSRKSSPC